MIKIAIVEDTKTDSDLLKDYIQEFLTQYKEQASIVSYSSGLKFLDEYENKYDVIFMDIELTDINGLETCKRLREKDKNVLIIFVTNMGQFAVEGYQVDALDFIVKPINYYSFALRMQRVIEHLSHNRKNDNIIIKNDKGVFFISPTTLKYVEVLKHEIIYHTEEKDISVRGVMKDVECELEKIGFFKCNRSYLVNINYVTSIQENTVTIGNIPLQISRPRRKEFLTAIASYYGEGGGK